MIKLTKTQKENLEWWHNPNLKQLTSQEYYSAPPPACAMSEIRYLQFLYYLLTKMNNEERLNRIKKIEVTNSIIYSESKVMPNVLAIQKKSEKLALGEKTYLCLNSKLAGTIVYSSILDSRGHAIRPIITNPIWLNETINSELSDSQKSETEQTKILLEVIKLIKKEQFFPAFLNLLRKLNVGADLETIEKNALLYQNSYSHFKWKSTG